MGAAIDYYYNYNLLLDQVKEHYMSMPDHEHFISYFAKVDYNSENNWYFPTRGSKFNARYGYYTDNFITLNNKFGLEELSAMWRINLSIGKHLTLQPMLYGRVLHCDNSPIILCNIMGGEWFGHYIDQQLPFAGVGNIELQWDKIFAAQIQAQYAATANSFILFKFAAGQDGDTYSEVLKRKTMLGSSLSYYYNAPIGPIGLSLGYSTVTDKPYFYLNVGYVF